MNTKSSIVFFGTGPVAARSLELLMDNFHIEAVVTKPKPPHHRREFPVLDVAKKNNLPILEVTDKESTTRLVKKQSFTSRVAVLIDFGIIVSQEVIDSFEKGIINSHFSLLPEWRGADPITFSILSGQEQTGVSLMLVVEKMDEGPILTLGLQPLNGDETTPVLTQSLINLSDALLKDCVPQYLAGKSNAIDQLSISSQVPNYPKKPSYSRKLTKTDGLINWEKTAEVIECEIRAYQDWPKSRTTLNGLDLTILKAHVDNRTGQPGKYSFTKDELIVHTLEKSLSIDKIKPSGKQAMDIRGFLSGYSSRL